MSELYDGQVAFTKKERMHRIKPADLAINDLVVAQVQVVRWPSGNKSSPYYRRDWKEWRVEFKLEHLALIYRASQHSAESHDLPETMSF